MKFATILADPPWPYNNKDGPRAAPEHRPNSWSKPTGAVGSSLRYGSMSMAELSALPVQGVADKPAHLYLWTTNSFMQEAHDLTKAWGFKQKTILTWVKVKKDSQATPSMKSGYYYRGATEHLLFCVRGSMRLSGPPMPTAFLHPRLPHSVKPDLFYDVIESQSPGPYLELFARRPREGWTQWGNQIESPELLEEVVICD